MGKKGKKRSRRAVRSLFRWLQGNDVVVKLYTSFAFILALTGVLTGFIFIALYEKNYVRSYTKLLTKQGKIISKRVSSFAYREREDKFQKYNAYVDELERAENTDVWIVSKKKADKPLPEEYANADADEGNISKGTQKLLTQTFENGRIHSHAEYDSIYGMTTLSVVLPVVDKETGETCGAVMMVSMIDRQTMGIREGKYLIVLSVLLALVISYVVAMLFARYLSTPLSRIGKNISKLAGGDYGKISVKKPRSQIGNLEKSLDYLAGRLRHAEREREELEQVRRDFFANVSHELRTPITVIRGYTETLADGVIEEPDQVRELHQKMLQECQGMERLVGDLFVLSKMQNPDFQIEKEPVSLTQIFGDVLRSGRMLAKKKELSIDFQAPRGEPCLMLGDYGRLRQMFLVILDNAVKFSHPNGQVNICLEREDGRLLVSIRDFGVGISEDQIPYIFEKFYTSKMRQNEKGTGLGLMIARQIALRHGGDITVESEEGKGATFYFDFEECTSTEGFE